jgi:prolycopene isomerase
LLAPLGDLGRRTAEDVIAREIGDSRLRALLGEFALGWLGLPASLTSAIPFLVAWASYHHYGGAYPDGGSEALSRAIADSIEAHGGTIRLGCAAARIVVRRRKVEAVELADGRIVTTRFVVSNANPLHTFGELVDQAELDQGTLARIRRMEPSMSAVKVWLGLSGGLPAGAPLDYDTYLNGAFGPVADEPDTGRISVLVPENIHRSAGEGLVSANPSSKVILTMLVPPRHLPEHASTDFKRRAGDTLVRRVEESLFPGLASRIDVMEIGAPETFARFTGNPGGSIYGWAPRPNQLGRLDPITAIDGLSLASAWTPPGGGFTSTLRSGQRAGRRLVGQLTGRLPKRTP